MECSLDQGIDFLGLNIVHLLNYILDLFLVSTNVNNENKVLLSLIFFIADSVVRVRAVNNRSLPQVQQGSGNDRAWSLEVGPDFTAFVAFKACTFPSAFLSHLLEPLVGKEEAATKPCEFEADELSL
ncbi:hypothetical protein QYF36_003948 [Acer negundo]|nr:hypothetical protein QYF36_003948 [Acer negundo]